MFSNGNDENQNKPSDLSKLISSVASLFHFNNFEREIEMKSSTLY